MHLLAMGMPLLTRDRAPPGMDAGAGVDDCGYDVVNRSRICADQTSTTSTGVARASTFAMRSAMVSTAMRFRQSQ